VGGFCAYFGFGVLVSLFALSILTTLLIIVGDLIESKLFNIEQRKQASGLFF